MRTAATWRPRYQGREAKGRKTRMAIIEARGLARTFTSRKAAVEAVRGVDLTVSEGEIVGFLGPNGAGKTTTLRMLTTLLRPTAGTATVAGADLLADPAGVRRRIGYVAQAIGATGGGSDPNATVGEEITLQAQLYRVPQGEIAERTSRLARQLDLGGLDDRLVKTLSGGQRRRLDISLGLVHSPGLVFREDLGTTIFLTTHYLDEADALCDRILVIDYGKIVAEGSPDDLKRRISGDVITLSVGGGPVAAKGVLGTHEGVRDVTVSGQSLRLTVDHGEEALPGMLRELDAAGLALQSIQLARPTLDDVFLTVTGRSLREDAPAAAPPDRVPVA